MSDYEKITPAEIRVGDVIFTGAQDREVSAAEYCEKYSHPGLKITRPAYLVTMRGYIGPRAYRPTASVIRRRHTEETTP